MRRTVALLAFCQALAMSGNTLVVTVTALAGKMLAGDPRLATLPLSLQFVFTALATIPAALLMGRFGRRIGFTVGQGFGIAGAALATYSIYHGSFLGFALATPLLGVHNAVWQHYRFAAAEIATAEFRPRAISYVLAGGVIAAVLGPALAKVTVDIAPAAFAGSYAAMIGLSAIAIVILQFVHVPTPEVAHVTAGRRRLGEIVSQPVFIVAVLSSSIGYGMMNLLMTSTPLAMGVCGYSFGQAATVIQFHVLGMFVPSFFTGHLIKRFGVVNVILVGCLMQALAVATAIAGIAEENFIGAMMMLGLGWNFMFIGGTTLLTEAYRPDDRAKTQAAHDFTVFAMVAITAFGSGFLHESFGWVAVNMMAVLPITFAFIGGVWFRMSVRAEKPAE